MATLQGAVHPLHREVAVRCLQHEGGMNQLLQPLPSAHLLQVPQKMS